MSKTWFETLSPENQEAILAAGEAFSDKWNNEIWPAATEEGVETLKEAGVEIIEVDKTPFAESVQGVVDNFLSNATPEQKALYDLLIEVKANY